MPDTIKLAFSTTACPDWTLEEVVRRAREYGYDGVELRTLGPGASALACDPALSEPTKVRELFGAAGVETVCLSTSIQLHYKDDSAGRAAVWEAIRACETAAAIGCPYVRVFGHEVRPGDNRQAVIRRIAERVVRIADRAGELGVVLLLENAGGFNKAKEWWWLLNLVEHPMVGLCWNVANAAAAGEPASVSVPTLNSRIKLAKVKDTRVGEGVGWLPLGEGTVGIEAFVKRLMGVGYGGYISVEWDRAWLPSLAPAEEFLPDARQRLRGWIEAIEAASAQARGAPAGSGTPAGQPAKAGAAHTSKTGPSAETLRA